MSHLQLVALWLVFSSVVGSVGGDTVTTTQVEPLLDAPAGWEFKDIGHLHYWSGEYHDTTSGAVVELLASSPERFESICQDYIGVDSVVATIDGMQVCEQHFQDARAWTLNRLKNDLKEFPVSEATYLDLLGQLPQEGAEMMWVTFMPHGSVWQFTSSYCTQAQRTRVFELLLQRPHPNLKEVPTTRTIQSAAPNMRLQRTAPCGLAAEAGSLAG